MYKIQINIPDKIYNKYMSDIEYIINTTNTELGMISDKIEIIDIENIKIIDELPKKERKLLKAKLEEIEANVYFSGGWKMHSGGFATTELIDWDENVYYIKLREGIQNDVENRVYTNIIQLNKETHEVLE